MPEDQLPAFSKNIRTFVRREAQEGKELLLTTYADT